MGERQRDEHGKIQVHAMEKNQRGLATTTCHRELNRAITQEKEPEKNHAEPLTGTRGGKEKGVLTSTRTAKAYSREKAAARPRKIGG